MYVTLHMRRRKSVVSEWLQVAFPYDILTFATLPLVSICKTATDLFWSQFFCNNRQKDLSPSEENLQNPAAMFDHVTAILFEFGNEINRPRERETSERRTFSTPDFFLLMIVLWIMISVSMQSDNDDDLLMIDSAVIVDSCHVIRSMLTSIIVYMHSVLGSRLPPS